jgi:hypothetical protein
MDVWLWGLLIALFKCGSKHITNFVWNPLIADKSPVHLEMEQKKGTHGGKILDLKTLIEARGGSFHGDHE